MWAGLGRSTTWVKMNDEVFLSIWGTPNVDARHEPMNVSRDTETQLCAICRVCERPTVRQRECESSVWLQAANGDDGCVPLLEKKDGCLRERSLPPWGPRSITKMIQHRRMWEVSPASNSSAARLR